MARRFSSKPDHTQMSYHKLSAEHNLVPRLGRDSFYRYRFPYFYWDDKIAAEHNKPKNNKTKKEEKKEANLQPPPIENSAPRPTQRPSAPSLYPTLPQPPPQSPKWLDRHQFIVKQLRLLRRLFFHAKLHFPTTPTPGKSENDWHVALDFDPRTQLQVSFGFLNDFASGVNQYHDNAFYFRIRWPDGSYDSSIIGNGIKAKLTLNFQTEAQISDPLIDAFCHLLSPLMQEHGAVFQIYEAALNHQKLDAFDQPVVPGMNKR